MRIPRGRPRCRRRQGRPLPRRTRRQLGGVYIYLQHIAFAADTKYRVCVHARVEAGPGAKGQAFQTAIFDAAPMAEKNHPGRVYDVSECADGYVWYDAIDWYPRPDDYFQIATGAFNAVDGGRPACRAVWIDKIEISAPQVAKADPRFF